MSKVPICVIAIALGTAWSVQGYLQSRQEQPSAVVEAAARVTETEMFETGVAREMSRPVAPDGLVDSYLESAELRSLLGGPAARGKVRFRSAKGLRSERPSGG